jgi:hypothetical protein
VPIYQVYVHVPRIRLPSEDVQKFFDSFQMSVAANAGGAAEGPRD